MELHRAGALRPSSRIRGHGGLRAGLVRFQRIRPGPGVVMRMVGCLAQGGEEGGEGGLEGRVAGRLGEGKGPVDEVGVEGSRLPARPDGGKR